MDARLSLSINDYWNGYLPVNIETMVQSLWHIHAHNQDHALLTHEHLYLPTTWQGTRQRYALAYAVHAYQYYKKTDITFTKVDFSIHDYTSQILNHRTLDTLIPRHILEFAVTHEGIVTLDGLSQLFHVSKAAIVTQCKRAGIIS